MITEVTAERLSPVKWLATAIVGNVQYTATGLTRNTACNKVVRSIRSLHDGAAK